jgi:hypothetical protein
MNIFLELLFIALVIADTVLTYKVLAKGGYREKMLMRYVIKYPAAAVAITVAGAGALMLFLAIANATWVLIFPIIAFGYACWKSWRILHG